MIPKILHLCWLSGDPYPEEVKKCLDSWKEKLPDYTVMLWDLSKVDVNVCNWTKQAWEKKRYAYVADYVRFFALYNYGGIYLDSDVEVLKSFDDLLNQDFFFGFEYSSIPEAAVIGAIKGQTWVKTCLDWYLRNDYLDQKGNERQIVAPLILRHCFESTMQCKLIDNEKMQVVQGGTIYSYEYFSARNMYTGKNLISENTYSLHHFNTGWLKEDVKVKTKRVIHAVLIKVLGKNGYNKAMYKIRNIIHNPRLGINAV
ncbi:MAG: hypothetical protein K5907_04060 [Treponema sp.]|nr:hypothetical protein [Treponema sp.]